MTAELHRLHPDQEVRNETDSMEFQLIRRGQQAYNTICSMEGLPAELLVTLQEVVRSPMIRYSWEEDSFSSTDTSDLLQKVAEGKAAYDSVVAQNMGLAGMVAKSFYEGNKKYPLLDYDDVVQEAAKGIMEAAARFQPQRNVKFSSIATEMAKRRATDAYRKAKRTEGQTNDIFIVSLDDSVVADSDTTLHEIVRDEKSAREIESQIESIYTRELIQQALQQLSPYWQSIYTLCYREELSLDEMASVLEITHSAASDVSYRFHQQLREKITALRRTSE